MFDYGAPSDFRMVLQRPNTFTTIIVQNGIAYFEGFGFFNLAITKPFYVTSEKAGSTIPLETYHLDSTLHR